MGELEIDLLSHSGVDQRPALARLLAQVSRSAPELTSERLRNVLRTPATSIFVAKLDGEIVGMAVLLTLTTLSGDFGLVEEVVVDKSARGQHISKHLMQKLLSVAAERGHRFVDLTSRPSRTAANGLYRSLGFQARETNCYRYRFNPPVKGDDLGQ